MAEEKRATEAELEDQILETVLRVTLVEEDEQEQQLQHEQEHPLKYLYLEKLAGELLSEGKGLALNKAVLQRVLTHSLIVHIEEVQKETPLVYLVGCYKRASEYEYMQRLQMQKMNLDEQIVPEIRAEIQDTLRQVMEVCVSSAGNLLLSPEIYPQPATAPFSRDPHSDLWELLLADNVAPFAPGFDIRPSNWPTLLPEFVADLIAKFPEHLGDIFNPVFTKLHQCAVNCVSPLGAFRGPLESLVFLVGHYELADVLLRHPLWHPQGEHINGRDLEVASILGPFFHVSALPDHGHHQSFSTGEPNGGQPCFSDVKSQTRHLNSSLTIRNNMQMLYKGLHEVLVGLIESGPENSETVLQYLVDLIQKNAKRAATQANPKTTGSNGMFVCLSGVMLRLCEEFVNDRIKGS
ncbi:unnamed protein product [Calypogeia fissa]